MKKVFRVSIFVWNGFSSNLLTTLRLNCHLNIIYKQTNDIYILFMHDISNYVEDVLLLLFVC